MAALVLCAAGAIAAGAEVLFHDGRREMAMVDAVAADGRLVLLSADGQRKTVAVEDLVSIRFWGRQGRSIRSGTQELHLVGGDRLRGQVLRLESDVLHVDSAAVGAVGVPLKHVHGLLALPVQGAAGRRAEELLQEVRPEPTGLLDLLLDRRSAAYEGVLERMDGQNVEFDDEQLRRTTSLRVIYLASVRLAEATRQKRPPLSEKVFLSVGTRDGGSLAGVLRSIETGQWLLGPLWDEQRTLGIRKDEIVYVEVLNGRTLYLSQLEPAEVREQTRLAPAQPYRRNRNCRGGVLSIAGSHYAWGLGVHGDSQLTYDIGGRFGRFTAGVGIDSQAAGAGSVVFTVLGDGKTLAQTPVVRGGQPPRELSASVVGVRRLTLRVESAGDGDLGDCADWADARLLRQAEPEGKKD